MSFRTELDSKTRKIIRKRSREAIGNITGGCEYVAEAMNYVTLGLVQRPELEFIVNDEVTKVGDMVPKEGQLWRPKILWAIAHEYGRKRSEVMSLCSIIEAFHSISLAMDDAKSQDGSAMRRGLPTCHMYFEEVFRRDGFSEDDVLKNGESIVNLNLVSGLGIFQGYVNDLKNLSDHKKLQIRKVLDNLNVVISPAQGSDLYDRRNFENRGDFIRMYRGKTGKLFGAAAKIGGIVGGAGNGNLDRLENFGIDLGTSYQLADDVIDAYASMSVTGKDDNQDGGKRNLFDVTTLDKIEDERKNYMESAMENLRNINGKKFIMANGLIREMTGRYEDLVGERLKK